jgi:hypothetical protein
MKSERPSGSEYSPPLEYDRQIGSASTRTALPLTFFSF